MSANEIVQPSQNNDIHLPTAPVIHQLENLWHRGGIEQRDITCGVNYHINGSVTFTWELVRQNGDVITIPGNMMNVTYEGWDHLPYHSSTLNYTLKYDTIHSMLRCIMHVTGEETHGSYKAKIEERIPSPGMCNDKVPEMSTKYGE